MSEELYARQHGTYRTVHESIIVAAKKLIAQHGFRAMNVVDLASEAEVSRATLYNHYRDKDSVLLALCESELARLVEMAQNAPDATSALEQISLQVSSDPALAAMRVQDPDQLALALTKHDDHLWKAFAIALNHLLGEGKSALALRWLLGQALHPINPQQSRAQAEAITGIANL